MNKMSINLLVLNYNTSYCKCENSIAYTYTAQILTMNNIQR